MGVPAVWRLIVVGAAVLFLSIVASLYSIFQLSTLSGTARKALDRDQRMINAQEELTDAFLSEFRYSGKYVISRKEGRYEQLRQFKRDFIRHLTELKSGPHSDRVTAALVKIQQIHGQYHKLFDQEVAYIRAGQGYAQSRYEQEREKLLESGLIELEHLKLELRAGLQAKLENIERSAQAARSITVAATVIVMMLGTFVAIRISSALAPLVKTRKLTTEAETLNVEAR